MKREGLINLSQQRPERASKIRAIENMTTTIVQPIPFGPQSGDEKIWLKFAKDIWNECQPAIQAPRIVTPKLKVVPKRRRKLAAITTEDRIAAPGPKRSPTQPRQCKVKITRFQYGGPDARVAGKHRNEITLEAPCLRPTCASCWEWHAHLIRSPCVTDTSRDKKYLARAPEGSPLSPDSRFRDIWRQTHQDRSNSTTDKSSQTLSSAQEQGSATPVLMPVKPPFKCQRAFDQTADLCTPCTSKTTSIEFNVFLPTHLLKHAAPAARRRRHRVRLVFGSQGGKESYTRLLERYLR